LHRALAGASLLANEGAACIEDCGILDANSPASWLLQTANSWVRIKEPRPDAAAYMSYLFGLSLLAINGAKALAP